MGEEVGEGAEVGAGADEAYAAWRMRTLVKKEGWGFACEG